MADVQHTNLTSAQCHEPKHISSSLTSQSGMVITPSSTTAGTSELRSLTIEDIDSARPYGNYADSTYTSGSPLAIASGVRTKITCDGLGSNTTEIDMPGGGSLWNSSTNKVTPFNEDDCYDLRVVLKANPGATNEDVTLELDIGGGVGVILEETRPLLRGAATNDLVFSWPIFCKSTFITNGGELYLTGSATSTDVWDISIYVVRVRKGA